jgi:hypothetical protein
VPEWLALQRVGEVDLDHRTGIALIASRSAIEVWV